MAAKPAMCKPKSQKVGAVPKTQATPKTGKPVGAIPFPAAGSLPAGKGKMSKPMMKKKGK